MTIKKLAVGCLLSLLPFLAVADEPKDHCPASFDSDPKLQYGECSTVCQPTGDKDCMDQFVNYKWAFVETANYDPQDICCMYSANNTLDAHGTLKKFGNTAADCEKYTCSYP